MNHDWKSKPETRRAGTWAETGLFLKQGGKLLIWLCVLQIGTRITLLRDKMPLQAAIIKWAPQPSKYKALPPHIIIQEQQQDCQALLSAISFCICSLNYTAFCFTSLSHCEFMLNLMSSVPLQSNTVHKKQYCWKTAWQEICLASLWILHLTFSKFTWEVLRYFKPKKKSWVLYFQQK